MMRRMPDIPLNTQPERERGFTLIELMVSMVIALVLLAGLYGNFIMQSRVQNAQAEVVEAAEDLRIAAQIMQSELRMARDICWDSTNKALVYRPLGTVDLNVCDSTTLASSTHGFFRDNGGAVCWKKPNNANCQELVRNLNTLTGLQVSPTGNGDLGVTRTIKLTSVYKNHKKQDKDWEVSFDALPRNQF